MLVSIRENLGHDFPTLQIARIESPRFRPLTEAPLTEAEDEALVRRLNASSAGLVMVILGCPNQAIWMKEQRGKVQAVMIGLGGAFPVYTGIHKPAPEFIRNFGFEWLYRLA